MPQISPAERVTRAYLADAVRALAIDGGEKAKSGHPGLPLGAAAARFGWSAVIGPDGIFAGMKNFGAGARHKDLAGYFGITPDAVLEEVSKLFSAQQQSRAEKAAMRK